LIPILFRWGDVWVPPILALLGFSLVLANIRPLFFYYYFHPQFLFLGDITSHVLSVAMQARSRMLGPFSPSFNIQNLLKAGLEKVGFYNNIWLAYFVYLFAVVFVYRICQMMRI